jgi:hypothetical protein
MHAVKLEVTIFTSQNSQHEVFYRCANFHACNQKLNNSVQFVHHIPALYQYSIFTLNKHFFVRLRDCNIKPVGLYFSGIWGEGWGVYIKSKRHFTVETNSEYLINKHAVLYFFSSDSGREGA